jgi:hypothetical protein
LQPAMKNGRCRMHGGKTPRGVELPHFSHGRYSKALPDRLSARYEEAISDADRHDLRDEIALSEAKIDDLLAGMKHGQSDALLLLLRTKERQVRAAEARGDSERAEALMREILTVIRLGGDESLAWKDVDRWIARKTRIIEADVRIAAIRRQMISVEEVMALIGLILNAIRRHVPDRSVRNALAKEIRAATEREDPGNAVLSLPPPPASAPDTERDDNG